MADDKTPSIKVAETTEKKISVVLTARARIDGKDHEIGDKVAVSPAVLGDLQAAGAVATDR